ncbi:MAG: PipA/GogA/GtgA family type III secretion system effector [Pararobbsia sp.]
MNWSASWSRGGGAMDPDATVDAAAYRNVLDCFAEVLIDAYQRSSTFRRLFNRAADTTLRETRWLLAPDHAFGTTVTNAQRIAAGNRAVIGLNLDAQSDYAVVETYVCDGPDHPFSIRRSYVHEMIHALTGLVDDDDGHPRGPVVEYENLVMKQMGDRSPARTAYRHIAQADCGDAAELDFAAVDFGDAFGN